MANKYVKQEKYGLLLLVEFVQVLSWSVTVVSETCLRLFSMHMDTVIFPVLLAYKNGNHIKARLCHCQQTEKLVFG